MEYDFLSFHSRSLSPVLQPWLFGRTHSEDILLDDARRFALYAREAGVPVELEVWPNMIHVWQTFGRRLSEAWQARAHIVRFTRAHAPSSIPSKPVLGAAKQSTS